LRVGMAEVGESDRELLVDELLVLRQREHRLEFGDRAVVVLLVVEVDVAEAPARFGIVRVLAAGGAVGLDRAVEVALFACALADLEEVLLQHDLAVLLLLAELHHLEEVAVILAVGQAHAVEAKRDLLAGTERRLADLLVVDVDGCGGRIGIDPEQRIVGREDELARLPALLDADLAGRLLVAVAIQQDRIALSRTQRDLGLAVGPGRALPFAVEIHVGARKRSHVATDAAFGGDEDIAALGCLAALAPRAPHYAVSDLDLLALPERGDVDQRARVFSALHLHAPDLGENDLAARGVELRLHQVAVAILGDAAEHDHVHGSTQRRVLPALGGETLDRELALLDLGLELFCRHLAEGRELEEVRRKRLLRLRGDAAQVGARGIAGHAIDADANRLGRGRIEVVLDADRAVQAHGRLPRRGDMARRRQRDYGLLARLAAVGGRQAALRVGLTEGLAVHAHGEPRQAARAAVFVGERPDRHHRLAVERHFDYLARLEPARSAVRAVALPGDTELGSLCRLLPIEVDQLALVVGHPRRLAADRDPRSGKRRALVVHAQGDVAHGLEVGVEAVLVCLAVLRQLDQESRLPRLDAVA